MWKLKKIFEMDWNDTMRGAKESVSVGLFIGKGRSSIPNRMIKFGIYYSGYGSTVKKPVADT